MFSYRCLVHPTMIIFIFFLLVPPTISHISLSPLILPSETLTFTLHESPPSPSFFFISDSPSTGIDPIHSFLVNHEEHIRSLFHTLLSQSPPSLVLDIGANRGFYTLLAASYNHSVESFDPQPHCELMLLAAVRMNALESKVNFSRGFVGRNGGVVKKRTGCVGTFPHENWDGWGDRFREPLRTLNGADDLVGSGRVVLKDRVNGRHVRLVKVDVEGGEVEVLEELKELIEGKLVDNVIVEFNWPMMKREGGNKRRERCLEWVKWVSRRGWRGKGSHRGSWDKQMDMSERDWEDLLGGEGEFGVVDAWFYRKNNS